MNIGTMTCSISCANVCFDFTIKPGWPGNQDARCKLLYDKILQQYQEEGVEASNRTGKLRLSNFCNPKAKFESFPEMSGCKARHIRYLVPCLLEICRDQVDAKKLYTTHRMKCLLLGKGISNHGRSYIAFA